MKFHLRLQVDWPDFGQLDTLGLNKTSTAPQLERGVFFVANVMYVYA